MRRKKEGEKPKFKTKEEQNEMAVKLAKRDGDLSIEYDEEVPLKISDELDILKISRIMDQGVANSPDLEEIKYKVQSIQVVMETDSHSDTLSNFKIFLDVTVPLSELEEKLLACNDYCDIEDLDDI